MWDDRVEAAIQRTEARGVSPIRAVPFDMIATALFTDAHGADVSDDDLDRLLHGLMQRNALPVPMSV